MGCARPEGPLRGHVMRRSITTVALAVTASITTAIAGLSSARGDDSEGTLPVYVGWSGGSLVYGLGGVVTSGYTAASSIGTTLTGLNYTNTTASVNVAGVGSVHAVHTSET